MLANHRWSHLDANLYQSLTYSLRKCLEALELTQMCYLQWNMSFVQSSFIYFNLQIFNFETQLYLWCILIIIIINYFVISDKWNNLPFQHFQLLLRYKLNGCHTPKIRSHTCIIVNRSTMKHPTSHRCNRTNTHSSTTWRILTSLNSNSNRIIKRIMKTFTDMATTSNLTTHTEITTKLTRWRATKCKSSQIPSGQEYSQSWGRWSGCRRKIQFLKWICSSTRWARNGLRWDTKPIQSTSRLSTSTNWQTVMLTSQSIKTRNGNEQTLTTCTSRTSASTRIGTLSGLRSRWRWTELPTKPS